MRSILATCCGLLVDAATDVVVAAAAGRELCCHLRKHKVNALCLSPYPDRLTSAAREMGTDGRLTHNLAARQD